MAHKKFLFCHRKAPYGSGRAAEMLEAVLIAAAFDQDVHLAFLDDGVFQLVDHQEAAAIGQKGLAEALSSLADYDIEHVWVERQSLADRGLTAADLMIPVTVVDRAELAQLMAGMDVVLGGA